MQKRLLIVESDHGLRGNIQQHLMRQGYRVATASDAGTALRMLEREAYDLVVVDLRLPDMDGSALAGHIRQVAPTTLILMISDKGNLHSILSLLRGGVYDYLAKPFLLSKLEQRIHHALSAGYQLHSQMAQRVEFQRRDQLEELVLECGGRVKYLLGELYWAAMGLNPVIITGEEGTGRQIAARLLYQLSSGELGNLICLNAESRTMAEIDSELRHFFAAYNREGCQSATLLLENLHSLSADLQSQLYTSIQQIENRVNGCPASARSRLLIATTVASQGRRLEDTLLLPRLLTRSVYTELRLPALREHMEDIPLITDYLLKQAREHHVKPILSVDTQAMRCLMAHDWPGNLQELCYVIESSVMRSQSQHLAVRDLPGYLQTKPPIAFDKLALH